MWNFPNRSRFVEIKTGRVEIRIGLRLNEIEKKAKAKAKEKKQKNKQTNKKYGRVEIGDKARVEKVRTLHVTFFTGAS